MEQGRAEGRRGPPLRRVVAMGFAALVACGLGCSAAHGRSTTDSGAARAMSDAAVAKRRVKPHTVRIELFHTAEQAIEQAADGSFVLGALTPIGGVEVCVVSQRAAFASFEPFQALEPPICTTSVEGQTVVLKELPINSDLVITFTKAGYEPGTMTFRTDEQDVAAPAWTPTFSTALVRERAVEPWLEPGPQAGVADGRAVIGVVAQWIGTEPVPGTALFGTGPTQNFVGAEDVAVEIEHADGSHVGELLFTLRDRPRFLSLPEGLYRMHFSHRIMNVESTAPRLRFMCWGLPTDAHATIEVPVVAGHAAGAIMGAFCHAPAAGYRLDDLATCTFTQSADAGMP